MRSLRITTALLIAAYVVGCAPVKFDSVPEKPCGTNGVACVSKCTGPDCVNAYEVSRMVDREPVDILIVNDNSGSMSPEQHKMAQRFPTFISSLGNLDYRIAMTTTDITSSVSRTYSQTNTPAPENNPTKPGYIQDGNLVTFGNGKKYLETSGGSNQSWFTTAVQRQETLTCESSGYTNCPSSDERGIFAANLAIDKNEFMRSNAHLAIVILSDEDERGDSSMAGYQLENYDRPQTLVDKMKTKFAGRSFSVHPIIVKPGDSACLNAQTIPSQYLRGVEGRTYAELKNIAGGTMGSICDTDYGSTLANIGDYVQQEAISLPFACRPINDDFDVTFTPNPGFNVDVEADFSMKLLKIKDVLPADTKITLKYECAK